MLGLGLWENKGQSVLLKYFLPSFVQASPPTSGIKCDVPWRMIRMVLLAANIRMNAPIRHFTCRVSRV